MGLHPPQALTEPDVNVSAHPAPIIQPRHRVISSEQTRLAAFMLYDPASGLLSGDVLVSVCIPCCPHHQSAIQAL